MSLMVGDKGNTQPTHWFSEIQKSPTSVLVQPKPWHQHSLFFFLCWRKSRFRVKGRSLKIAVIGERNRNQKFQLTEKNEVESAQQRKDLIVKRNKPSKAGESDTPQIAIEIYVCTYVYAPLNFLSSPWF